MAMITRRQFEILVERVVAHITEAAPPAKTGNFRYDASGNSAELPEEPISGTTKTQMPPTMPPQTVPAPRSTTQQQADVELSKLNTKNPSRVATAPSQKQIKVKAIKKALDTSGYTQTPEGQKNAVQSLDAWYDKLDPSDALVATADELAQRFSSGE